MPITSPPPNCLCMAREPTRKDSITIDVSQRLLQVDLSDAQLAERRAAWLAPQPNYSKGVMAKYAKLASQADDGAVTGA